MPVLDDVRALLVDKAPATFTNAQVQALLPQASVDDVSHALHYLSTSDARFVNVSRGRYRCRDDMTPDDVFAGKLQESRFKIAKALVELGGAAVDDPGGFATKVLSRQVFGEHLTGKATQPFLAVILAMENDGQLVRVMKNQRRTLSIAITDKGRADFLLTNWKPPAEPAPEADLIEDTRHTFEPRTITATVEQDAAGEVTSAECVVEPSPVAPLPPAVAAQSTQASIEAGDLLRAVVSVLGDGVESAKGRHDDQQARTLGRMHEQADKLKREVERLMRRDRELSDLVSALKHETSGLRQQLQTADINLRRLTAGANEIEGRALEGFKAVDREMRAVPGFAKTG